MQRYCCPLVAQLAHGVFSVCSPAAGMAMASLLRNKFKQQRNQNRSVRTYRFTTHSCAVSLHTTTATATVTRTAVEPSQSSLRATPYFRNSCSPSWHL